MFKLEFDTRKGRRLMRKLCHCGKQSLPGLISGVALCDYHYTERQWGKAWADKCFPKSSRPTAEEESPSYRNAMRDAGRGRLLP